MTTTEIRDNQTVIDLPVGWREQLASEFDKEYMHQLRTFLVSEIKKGKTIFPHGKNIFQALKLTDFDQVKVVIIGQDPYHGEGQAHGLCFSVRTGIAQPPSLKNIFKELQNDLGITPPSHGNLESWAKQGVLLLNAVLTVEKDLANSHQNRGWEQFTDQIINKLNSRRDPIVFLLWGSPAQKKAQFVDEKRHAVLKAPHPSPLSAHRGFLGCRHFSRCNQLLRKWGKTPIDWNIN